MNPEELVWLEPASPVGDEEIAKVEKELEVIFPDDYRAFLRKSQGGMPAQTDFKLRDPRKTTAAVGMFLSTAPGRDSDYIVSAAKILSDRLPPAVVPVAIGPGGDYVVLDLREARPRVLYWHHERAGEPAEFTFVSDSFAGFIGQLYEPDAETEAELD
ncbi:SMI1/KNR4 family protein [Cystobacter ferrugineus]|uniref:Knr4/Smi1-like domain-containing protein n=1 Tax=Cystobacter ferrugineus TaxID=83449 RepID=A0A1L9AVC2_9BACT|nr:SMI1/KNR4 family protein [Cystobacter ferrugineus]OJH33946.1 hypothetical protein BON30_46330 [Cystobacter ferrugineus]